MQERRSVQKSFIFKYKIMSYRDFTINIIIQKFTLCNIWLNFCLPVCSQNIAKKLIEQRRYLPFACKVGKKNISK